MVEIEHLCLRLPHFLRADAASIANAVASAIAGADLPVQGRIGELKIPRVVLSEGASATVAARQISAEVLRALEKLSP